jgi:hypothetical protein
MVKEWCDSLMAKFFERFPPPLSRVLEVTCYHGGNTVHLARNCRDVVVIEGRAENIRIAVKAVEEAGFHNVAFIEKPVQSPEAFAWLGRFEVVWLSGILYHVARPWELIDAVCRITDRVGVWTHLGYGTEHLKGFRGDFHDESDTPANGLGTEFSFWLTAVEISKRFSANGMVQVFREDFPAPEHPAPAEFSEWRKQP